MNFFRFEFAVAVVLATIAASMAGPVPRTRLHEIRGPIVGHYHVRGTDLEVAVTEEMVGKVFAVDRNAARGKRMGSVGVAAASSTANKQHFKHKSMAHRKGCFGFLPPYDDPSGPIQHIKNFEKFVGVNAMAVAHDVLGALYKRLGYLVPQVPPQ